MRKKVLIRKTIQKRAEDLKSLQEQRADKIQQMKDLSDTAETEKRAFSEEEEAQFDVLEKEVQAIDKTIERIERARAIKLKVTTNEEREKLENKELEEREERAFEYYIRKACGAEDIQLRAGEQNLTMGNNGAVIPTTIANRIITAVKDICPIYAMSNHVSCEWNSKSACMG